MLLCVPSEKLSVESGGRNPHDEGGPLGALGHSTE